jgi:hypothetical protein
MNLRLKPILAGLLTQAPWLQKFIHRKGTGGTCDAGYCYGVWLKHLVMLHARTQCLVPRVVAELGPGDSLGIGFAALLSGAEQFIALDVERYNNTTEVNLRIFDQLLALFQARAPRPTKGWPDFDEHLDAALFPSHILTDAHLAVALAPERIAHLRTAISQLSSPEEGPSSAVRYVVPWSDANIVEAGSVDMILSQSVLEHVNDLPPTYAAFSRWIKPGSYFSQQVDFSSHGIASYWNGHWAYPEWLWKVILGKRGYLLNRQPWSTHTRLAQEHGFELITTLRHERSDGLKRSELSAIANGFTEEDARTDSLFFQGRR